MDVVRLPHRGHSWGASLAGGIGMSRGKGKAVAHLWRAKRCVAALGAALVAFATLGVPQAHAAVVTISNTDLTGGNATWDPEGYYDYGSGGPCVQTQGVAAVYDGSFGSQSDAFDTGGYTVVGGKTFAVPSDQGQLTGQNLIIGPSKTNGLRVVYDERALQTSPTLRVLVKLNNPSRHALSRAIIWDSALGADDDAATRKTSSGDALWRLSDRWAVFSDDPTSPTDAPVTMSFFGPNAAEPPTRILYHPEADNPVSDAQACVTIRYNVKVPAKSTRTLLFFMEVHSTNQQAEMTAKRFTNVKAGSNLMTGVSKSERKHILNYDFG